MCSSSSSNSKLQLNKQINKKYQTIGVVCPAFLSFLAIKYCIFQLVDIIALPISNGVNFRSGQHYLIFLECNTMILFFNSLLQARRRRGRTPTPGRYLGLKTVRGKLFPFLELLICDFVFLGLNSFLLSSDCLFFVIIVRRRTPSYSPRRSPNYYSRRSPSYSSRRSPSYSPYRRSLSRSSRSSDRSRSRSYSPDYRRRRSYSSYYRRQRSYSPYYIRRDYRRRSYSRSQSPYSRSPVSRRDRSYSPYYSRDYSPSDDYYERRHYHRSRSISPRARRSSRRGNSRSFSPRPRRSRRRYSLSVSPPPRSSRKNYSPSISPSRRRSRSYRGSSRRDLSPGSHSVSSRSRSASPSMDVSSRSISRSASPRSASPSS